MSENKLVAINFASFVELLNIPGVGTKTAGAIEAYRLEHGNIDSHIFQSLARKKMTQEQVERIDYTLNRQLNRKHEKVGVASPARKTLTFDEVSLLSMSSISRGKRKSYSVRRRVRVGVMKSILNRI